MEPSKKNTGRGNGLAVLDARSLLAFVRDLRDNVRREGAELYDEWRPRIRRRIFALSALNLAHYLALRRRDLRHLQAALMPWGLSSLGRCESRVMGSLDAVAGTLAAISGEPPAHRRPQDRLRAFFRGERLLAKKAGIILGEPRPHRGVRVMVTLPSEAATDPAYVRRLLSAGMDCARINCAHDGQLAWNGMIRNLRDAECAVGRRCKVLMDLGGPRARIRQAASLAPERRLFAGDRVLFVNGRSEPLPDPSFAMVAACEPLGALHGLEPGHRVFVDEGRLIAKVEEVRSDGCATRVTFTPHKGARLEPEKGLNFPDSLTGLESLTEKDLTDLDFIAVNADIVGYSFVQDAADVDRLHAELDARGCSRRAPAVVIKVETAKAVRNLHELIVHSAGRRPLAVMIARGDLAIEIGFERLAEMQEEIMWLCEAAHVPVIWATQVLERLVKKGTPSRAEITDAAMAVRAECVMLNKGPYILEGIGVLDDVLTRMQAHQSKKTPQLRALRSWTGGAAQPIVTG